MAEGASREQAERVAAIARGQRFHAEIVGNDSRLAVAITGGAAKPAPQAFNMLPGVGRVVTQSSPYFLASRLYSPEDVIVDVGGIPIGGNNVVTIAGPCAVESEEQLFAVAERVQKRGVSILRAGAWKLRTSPWSFQGLESKALDLLAEVKRSTGLKIVTEVVSETTLGIVAEVADLVQIGARNMKNYPLLKAVGGCGRPALLKRGPDALLSELLSSAEYLLAAGSPGVILCERGVSGFGDHARNTLDLAVVPAVKKRSPLPILVDPSHGTGNRDMVLPLSRAAIAVGADGLLVEVHNRPEEALSDGPQALSLDDFDRLMDGVAPITAAIGRSS